jgi:hypothetical protein
LFARLESRADRVVRAILVKDLLFFTRDLTYITVWLMPVLMSGLMLLSVLRGPAAEPSAATSAAVMEIPRQLLVFLGFMVVFSPVWMTYFMGTMFGTYLVIPLISLEGRSFWILRSTPLSGRQFLTAKLFVGLILILAPYAAFTAILQVILGHGTVAPLYAVYTHLTQALTLTTLVALYLNLSARQARFDWLHPGRLIHLGTLLNSVIGLAFVLAAIVFYYVLPGGMLALGFLPAAAIPAGLAAGALFCWLVYRWQFRLASERVEKLFMGE